MSPDLLESALQHATDTRRVVLDRNVIPQTGAVFRQLFGDRPAVIIADQNTFRAAGQSVLQCFGASAHTCLNPFTFTDENLYAEHTYVNQLEQFLRDHDAIPVAVGSGTINDLTKLAAHRTNRPYVAVA